MLQQHDGNRACRHVVIFNMTAPSSDIGTRSIANEIETLVQCCRFHVKEGVIVSVVTIASRLPRVKIVITDRIH